MAAGKAAARARRLLALLHLFGEQREISLEAVAEAVGSTPDEIASDLEALACCGLPPYTPDALLPIFVDGGEVVVWGELPALDRVVRLSRAEARALWTALEAAGIGHDDPLWQKLRAAAAPADGEIESVMVGSSAGSEQLKQLALGLEQGRVVEIEYQAVGRDALSVRAVEPLSLLNERGHWYLEAFCRKTGALRTFRTDRIKSLRLLDQRFEKRELSTTGTAFVAEGLPIARIAFDAGEQFSERDWPGGRVVETSPEGVLVAEVPFSGTAWIARQVAARLGAAEVLSPPELRDAVAQLASRAQA